MSEQIAITINLKTELFEDVKRFAKETNVPWQMAAASLIEVALKLTRDGQTLAAEDAKPK
jgi:uncharacterized protein (DUF111 family)